MSQNPLIEYLDNLTAEKMNDIVLMATCAQLEDINQHLLDKVDALNHIKNEYQNTFGDDFIEWCDSRLDTARIKFVIVDNERTARQAARIADDT